MIFGKKKRSKNDRSLEDKIERQLLSKGPLSCIQLACNLYESLDSVSTALRRLIARDRHLVVRPDPNQGIDGDFTEMPFGYSVAVLPSLRRLNRSLTLEFLRKSA